MAWEFQTYPKRPTTPDVRVPVFPATRADGRMVDSDGMVGAWLVGSIRGSYASVVLHQTAGNAVENID